MTILLLFNESIEWTVEQIQNKTKLDLELLLESFHNLLEFNILISDKEIDKNSTLRLSENFQKYVIILFN
jgi:hypothetical protein